MTLPCYARSVTLLLTTALLALSACQTDGNRPPNINDIIVTQIGQDSKQAGFDVLVDATDPDGDPITYAYSTSQFGVGAVPTGPGQAAAQSFVTVQPAWVTVEVRDDQGGRATNRFDVWQANRSPMIVLHAADNATLTPTDQTTIQAIATDADIDPLSMATSLTAGSSLATLSGASTAGGIHSVTLSTNGSGSGVVRLQTTVEDGSGARATSSFEVDVLSPLSVVDEWLTPGSAPAPGGQAFAPYALAFDAPGNLYVSSAGTEIIVFDRSGARQPSKDIALPGSAPISGIRAIAVDDSNGLIYVGHDSGTALGRVLVFDLAGNRRPDWVIDTTTLPHYLLRRPDGLYYVSDSTTPGSIKLFDAANHATVASFGSFARPRQIALRPHDGSLFIADRDSNTVRHVAADGTPIADIAAGLLDQPHGVAYHQSSNVVVIGDTFHDRLLVYSPGGRALQTVTLPSGSQPRYILVGPDDRLYVASFPSRRIYVLAFQ